MSDLNKAGRQPDTEIPDRETILRRWDTWQKRIAADKDVSWARHEFETLLAAYDEEIERLKAELDEAGEIIQQQLGFPFGASERARAFLSKHSIAE